MGLLDQQETLPFRFLSRPMMLGASAMTSYVPRFLVRLSLNAVVLEVAATRAKAKGLSSFITEFMVSETLMPLCGTGVILWREFSFAGGEQSDRSPQG